MIGFKYRGVAAAVVALAAATAALPAMAWTDKIEPGQDINSACAFEPEANCDWAVRIGAQQPGIDMSYASMVAMRLDGANLAGANFTGAIIQLANLKAADLTGANLEGAHMHAVNLQGAKLADANLTRVNFLDADLSGADLRGARIDGAIFIAAKLDNVVWPDGRVCAVGSKGSCR